jgi:DNA-binding LytR/AlgR family response regulator
MVRVLICDDEQLAVQRLVDLLAMIDDVEVVATAGDGKAALEAVSTLRPDAVLLDVEMPLLDGFDVVEELARSGGESPLIVFVTAFPHFAANAFDTGAIDFLTKPVRLGRLENAIRRVARASEDRTASARLRELAGQLEALRKERDFGFRENSHIWVHRRGESVRVDLDRIDWIRAEGEYVRLMVGEDSYLHREPIASILTRLDEERFVRIHRSYIVNREKLTTIRRRATGSYEVLLGESEKIPVGRNYRKLVRSIAARDERSVG